LILYERGETGFRRRLPDSSCRDSGTALFLLCTVDFPVPFFRSKMPEILLKESSGT